MNTYTVLKSLERRIRMSKNYDDWVRRNKIATCLCCNTTENLECHHVVELYPILNGLWKLYGDAEKVYTHAIAMHDNDRCESATMCNECHAKHHPAKFIRTIKEVRTGPWTPLPRNWEFHFWQSTLNRPTGHLGLIGFQTVLGIGWYILNGHLDSRMITFNRRHFAKLLGKTPSSSFNKSLQEALLDLKHAGILIASHIAGNDVELHISDQYLSMLFENPWFMPFDDIKTSKPCVLLLKWWLGMISNRTIYRISRDKLIGHIGINTTASQMAARALRMACKRISWAKIGIDKGVCTFTLKKRGSTPIFSLRACLQDAIQKGK